MQFTRRQLLAGAAAGATGVAGAAVLSSDAVAHTASATVGSEPSVRVAWTETYNGAVVERGDETADGPVLGIGNAQPGDSGSLAFRVTPTSDEDVRAWFSLAVTDNAENGRNEPELSAGDETADRGELAGAIETAVWYDAGSFGIDGLGGCDGDRDAGETVLVDGSLTDADDALADGVRLGGDCISSDGGVCVGISWALPSSVGNRVQGDSVDTSLSFTVEPCGGQ